MSDFVIDETNFDQYFRDVKKSRPQHGDVMAVYRATAELADGNLKQQIVDALCSDEIGAKKATQLLIKLGQTNRREAIKVVKSICADLFAGMPKSSVLAKSYVYAFEMFFYTKKEYIPDNDVHWETVTMKNLDEYLDKTQSK